MVKLVQALCYVTEFMEISIISPEGTSTYYGIVEASLPTTMGMITIRPGHVNLTTLVVSGKMTRHDDTVLDELTSFSDNTKHHFISA